MMHAPTPPTIPYYSLFQEELFKIRPSPLRQFLRRILVSNPCRHSKHMIVSNRTKTVSINVESVLICSTSLQADVTTLIQIQLQNRNHCKRSSTPICTCLNGKTTP